MSITYNVVCRHCGNVFSPAEDTPLWQEAKRRAEKGFLDALHVEGEECGCIEAEPNYRH